MFSNEYLKTMFYGVTTEASVGDSKEDFVPDYAYDSITEAFKKLFDNVEKRTDKDGLCYYFREEYEDGRIGLKGSGYIIRKELMDFVFEAIMRIVDSIYYLVENDCLKSENIELFKKIVRSGTDMLVYRYACMTEDEENFEHFENQMLQGPGDDGRKRITHRLKRLVRLAECCAPKQILTNEIRMVADCLLAMYCPVAKYCDEHLGVYMEYVKPNDYNKAAKKMVHKIDPTFDLSA